LPLCHGPFWEKLHIDQLRVALTLPGASAAPARLAESSRCLTDTSPWRNATPAPPAPGDPLAVARPGGWPGPGKLPSGNPGGTCMANRPVNTGSGGAATPPPVQHAAAPAAPAAAPAAPAGYDAAPAAPAGHRAARTTRATR